MTTATDTSIAEARAFVTECVASGMHVLRPALESTSPDGPIAALALLLDDVRRDERERISRELDLFRAWRFAHAAVWPDERTKIDDALKEAVERVLHPIPDPAPQIKP